jgi:mono/diheme cytochrome c family protein
LQINQVRLFTRLLILTLLTLTAACSGANSTPITFEGTAVPGEVIARGQQLYTQYCAACHGVDGVGQFPDAPLEPDATGRYGAPPHNDSGHTWHHHDQLLLQIVREGGMGDPSAFYPMPAFGTQLSDEQIVSIIGYIKTLWTDEHRAYQQRESEAED